MKYIYILILSCKFSLLLSITINEYYEIFYYRAQKNICLQIIHYSLYIIQDTQKVLLMISRIERLFQSNRQFLMYKNQMSIHTMRSQQVEQRWLMNCIHCKFALVPYYDLLCPQIPGAHRMKKLNTNILIELGSARVTESCVPRVFTFVSVSMIEWLFKNMFLIIFHLWW